MVEREYPGWKNEGKIVSSPVARISKILLPRYQMSKKLASKVKPTCKGENAEIRLYGFFVDGFFRNQPGMIVFPNIDSSHIFKTPVARVEIDMVLVHSKKGVFLFNVKNEGGKGTSSKRMEKKIREVKRFLRLLGQYGNVSKDPLAIHTVICNFANDSSKFSPIVGKTNDSDNEKVVILSCTDLDRDNFCETWNKKLEDAGIVDQDLDWDVLDQFVARLIVLVSSESGSTLIHEQFTPGLMQSTKNEENLIRQIGFEGLCGSPSKLQEVVVRSSSTTNQKGKTKFILWTKEQIEVVNKVGHALLGSTKQSPLKLMVSGGRGAGKTMLLVTLAKIAAEIFCLSLGEVKEQVLVVDGTFESTGLQKMFESTLNLTNVAVCKSGQRLF